MSEKLVPRQLESFGVAGLLGAKGKVYYENLYSTRHSGRISDLLSAKLREKGVDERRLRALIVSAIFEGWRRNSVAGTVASDAGPRPMMTLECGVDAQGIAIAISFPLPAEADIEAANLIAQGATDSKNNPFGGFISGMISYADRMVFRFHRESVKAEIVALLDLREAPSEAKTLQVVELRSLVEPVEVGEYVELGDLDYPKLLVADNPNLKDDSVLPLPVQLVKGTRDEDDEETRIKGTTDQRTDEAVVVPERKKPKGLKRLLKKIWPAKKAQSDVIDDVEGEEDEPAQDEEVDTQIKGTTDRREDEEIVVPTRKKSKSLKRLLKKMWSAKKAKPDVIDDMETEEEEPAQEVEDEEVRINGTTYRRKDDAIMVPDSEESENPKGFKRLFEKVWPFKKPEPETSDDAADDETQPSVQALVGELQNNIERVVTKAKQGVEEIKSDSKSGRTQRWLDGLMGDLLIEKARIAEMSKKLSLSMRQKELEFLNKERTLREEMRNKEDSLRQRTRQLSLAKDQLTQANLLLERMRNASANNSGDQYYKQKHAATQKSLDEAKEENAKNAKELAQLRAEVAQTDDEEVVQLRSQIEEMEKANAELTEKLAERKGVRGSTAPTGEDAKKKIEMANKLAANAQKENTLLQLRIEEMEKDESRLNRELEKANQELKSLKAKRLAA